MLRAKQILIKGLVLGAGVFNLVACGQTGPLYLPIRATPIKRPANTETTPSTPPSVDVQAAPQAPAALPDPR